MPDVELMCVEGFVDDEPAWAALIQMDLVSVVETDEGSGGAGFLFSPRVCLHFDIFTASLNLLYLFSPIQHVLPCTPPAIYSVSLHFHIPIPQIRHIPVSMSKIVYFCGWMNDDFLSERLRSKHCTTFANMYRIWNELIQRQSAKL